MDNLSSSNIHQNVIVFSNRPLNAWNATIKSGSTVILGGSRDILQDVLRYRMGLQAVEEKSEVANLSEKSSTKIENKSAASLSEKSNIRIKTESAANSVLAASSQTPSIYDDFEILTGEEASRAAQVNYSYSPVKAT